MRGKLVDIVVWVVGLRITPADAGKTFRSRCYSFGRWDHPRGCGENRAYHVNPFGLYGSPPRMRGKRAICSKVIKVFRITPADAGKTIFRKLNERTNQDHPRGCGENPKKIL